MKSAPLLAAALLVAAPALAQGDPQPKKPKTPSVRAEFDAALKVFNADPQKAIAPLEKLVTTRWSELSAKGRHGAATLLIYALLAAKQPAKAHTVGVALHRRMPAAFLALGRLTKGRDATGKDVRDAVDLIALRVERWRSVVYLHNASRRDLRLDMGSARCAVTYRYSTARGKIARHTSEDRRGIPGGILVLPRGGGAFLHSRPDASLGAKVADPVTVLAYEAKRRLRGWIHLGEGDYRQTVERLTLNIKARWGGAPWADVTLVELTRGKSPAKPKTPTTPTPTKTTHPSYARVGQRWTFRLPGGVTLVKQVLALEAGGVKVRSTALIDGKPLRAPTVQLWKAPPPASNAKALSEKVVVSGRVFECQIVRADSGARLWSVPVFPGIVKSVHKGRTTLELIDISE